MAGFSEPYPDRLFLRALWCCTCRAKMNKKTPKFEKHFPLILVNFFEAVFLPWKGGILGVRVRPCLR
jgi:hypothetical protein